jgi:hypothetical protein
VQLIKGTSLAAIIGFVELSRSGQLVSSITYKPLLAFGLVAVCYLALVIAGGRAGDERRVQEPGQPAVHRAGRARGRIPQPPHRQAAGQCCSYQAPDDEGYEASFQDGGTDDHDPLARAHLAA